jgi:hypothetical protein
MSHATFSSELIVDVLPFVCGGRGLMDKNYYYIESWSQKAPYGYRCPGGRWLMGIWAVARCTI